MYMYMYAVCDYHLTESLCHNVTNSMVHMLYAKSLHLEMQVGSSLMVQSPFLIVASQMFPNCLCPSSIGTCRHGEWGHPGRHRWVSEKWVLWLTELRQVEAASSSSFQWWETLDLPCSCPAGTAHGEVQPTKHIHEFGSTYQYVYLKLCTCCYAELHRISNLHHESIVSLRLRGAEYTFCVCLFILLSEIKVMFGSVCKPYSVQKCTYFAEPRKFWPWLFSSDGSGGQNFKFELHAICMHGDSTF